MRNRDNDKRRVPISGNSQAVFPYGKYGFPCELYNDDIDEFVNCMVEWHWQLELEFSVIQKGSVDLFVQNNIITVHENEGYIIFPNKLHKVQKDGENNGIYRTMIVSPQLIYGDNKSILFHKYYLSVIDTVTNGFIIFNNGMSRSKNILRELDATIKLMAEPSPKYELEIYKHFINIWEDIYDSVQDTLCCNSMISEKDEELTKKILLFIHTNYSNEISLNDIARSGNISKSECSRLFQRALSCTPFDYLINYRISKSQEYLGNEKYSITDIAGLVGFNSVNYYTTVFRKHLGYTPSQYKKLLKQSFAKL